MGSGSLWGTNPRLIGWISPDPPPVPNKVVATGGVTREGDAGSPEKGWSRRSDLNRGPADYESAALPTELRRLRRVSVVNSSPLGKPFCAIWNA